MLLRSVRLIATNIAEDEYGQDISGGSSKFNNDRHGRQIEDVFNIFAWMRTSELLLSLSIIAAL